MRPYPRKWGLEVKGPSEDHLKCNSIAVFHMINLIVYPQIHGILLFIKHSHTVHGDSVNARH